MCRVSVSGLTGRATLFALFTYDCMYITYKLFKLESPCGSGLSSIRLVRITLDGMVAKLSFISLQYGRSERINGNTTPGVAASRDRGLNDPHTTENGDGYDLDNADGDDDPDDRGRGRGRGGC